MSKKHRSPIGGTCFVSTTGGASIPIAISGVADVALGGAAITIAKSVGSNASKQSEKDKEILKKLEGEGKSGTKPSLEKGGKPKGKYTNKANTGLKRQDEAADLLASEGYDITMLEEIDGGNGYGIAEGSNPDFLIEGEVFDCYTPLENTPFKNIKNTLGKKLKTQAEKMVLNLDEYPIEAIDDLKSFLLSQTENGDLKRLQELIVIRDGKIITWFVR